MRWNGCALSIALHVMSASWLCAQTDTSASMRCARLTGDEKLRACNQAIESGKLDPANLSIAYINRSTIFSARGEDERRLADINAAVQADSTYVGAYVVRARYYRQHGQESEARRDFEWVIRQAVTAGDANGYLGRARAHIDLGQLTEAMVDLDSAQRIDSAYLQVYTARASIHETRRDYGRAVREYQAALKFRPGLASLYTSMGSAYFNMARYPEALIAYDSAIAIEPSVASNYASRAWLHRYMGNADLMIADYATAIRLEPSRAIRYTARANAYTIRGDWPSAMADYDHAVTLEPDRGFVWDARASAREYQGDYVGALADRDKTIQLEPKDADWRVSRAWTLLNLGREQSGLSGFADAIAIDPGVASRYASRAAALLELGHLDAAVADLNRAIELDPKAGFRFDSRAAAWMYHRAPTGGLPDVDRAVAADKDFEPGASRGRLYLAAGSLDDAIREYGNYVARRPNASLGYDGRGLAFLVKGDAQHAVEDLRQGRAFGALSAARELWLHCALLRAGQDSRADLQARIALYDPRKWPAKAFSFALGKATLDEMLAAARDSSALVTRSQLATAYFVAGEHYLAVHLPLKAREMFLRVQAQNLADTFADVVASAELSRPPGK